MPDPLSREEIEQRLKVIFAGVPETVVQGHQAAAAVYVCLYVGAVSGQRKIRPTTVLWMSDEAAAWQSADDREAWYRAAMRGRKAVVELLRSRGMSHHAWYADNSREPLRDETFRRWGQYRAILRDESGATTYSGAAWSLDPSFARLFDPSLAGDELAEAIAAWQTDHLGTVALTRIALARQTARSADQVEVSLPGGGHRRLAPGASSLILKGVLEEWAVAYLRSPAVLFISESREHLDVVDEKLLTQLGITIKRDRLLPDALIFDADNGAYWFIEVVASDGPINEQRKGELIRWAKTQGIPEANCRFLTAFLGRAHPAFRKRVPDLAWGTYAWFLDEPDRAMELIEAPR